MSKNIVFAQFLNLLENNFLVTVEKLIDSLATLQICLVIFLLLLPILIFVECHVIFDSTRLSFNYNPIIIKNLLFFRENRAK
jgi:hypothetical protein